MSEKSIQYKKEYVSIAAKKLSKDDLIYHGEILQVTALPGTIAALRNDIIAIINEHNRLEAYHIIRESVYKNLEKNNPDSQILKQYQRYILEIMINPKDPSNFREGKNAKLLDC